MSEPLLSGPFLRATLANFFFFFFFFLGISYPTLHAFLVDVAGQAQLGRTQALFNGAFNLGVSGSAFAFGLVAEVFGYRAMFTWAALTPIAAGAVFMLGTRAVQGRAVS